MIPAQSSQIGQFDVHFHIVQDPVVHNHIVPDLVVHYHIAQDLVVHCGAVMPDMRSHAPSSACYNQEEHLWHQACGLHWSHYDAHNMRQNPPTLPSQTHTVGCTHCSTYSVLYSVCYSVLHTVLYSVLYTVFFIQCVVHSVCSTQQTVRR